MLLIDCVSDLTTLDKDKGFFINYFAWAIVQGNNIKNFSPYLVSFDDEDDDINAFSTTSLLIDVGF